MSEAVSHYLAFSRLALGQTAAAYHASSFTDMRARFACDVPLEYPCNRTVTLRTCAQACSSEQTGRCSISVSTMHTTCASWPRRMSDSRGRLCFSILTVCPLKRPLLQVYQGSQYVVKAVQRQHAQHGCPLAVLPCNAHHSPVVLMLQVPTTTSDFPTTPLLLTLRCRPYAHMDMGCHQCASSVALR